MLRVETGWGFDCLSCPMGGEFDFSKSQIPTFAREGGWGIILIGA